MLVLTAEWDGGFRMLRKLLFCLAMLVVAGPAAADDAMLCSSETGDAAVAACTRAINSGAGQPSINYYNRGEAYRVKGDTRTVPSPTSPRRYGWIPSLPTRSSAGATPTTARETWTVPLPTMTKRYG